MARTRDEAAFRAKRAQILRAAEALFVEHGFHQTGIAAICRAVDMSPGALYRYFASKPEMIRALIEEEQADAAALFDRVQGAKAFRPALVRALEDTIRVVSAEDYGRLALDIAAEGQRDPDVAAMLATTQDILRERLARLIREAQDGGQVASQVDADASARMLLMLVDGATGDRRRVAGFSKRSLRASLTRLVDGLLR